MWFEPVVHAQAGCEGCGDTIVTWQSCASTCGGADYDGTLTPGSLSKGIMTGGTVCYKPPSCPGETQTVLCNCQTSCSGQATCYSGDATCSNGQWTCPNDDVPCMIGEQPSCEYGAICLPGGWECNLYGGSPIIIDTAGLGFHLTSAQGGVTFKLFPEKPPAQVAWTDPKFGNGWLALDRNENGRIDDGSELFGNLTPQPPSNSPNGYLALAVFDDLKNGGNGNGEIDPGDSVYSKLVVWIDANHNGISEPDELHKLADLGIVNIGLHYVRSDYVDSYGNRFRYRSTIEDAVGQKHDNCYDVYLQYIMSSR